MSLRKESFGCALEELSPQLLPVLQQRCLTSHSWHLDFAGFLVFNLCEKPGRKKGTIAATYNKVAENCELVIAGKTGWFGITGRGERDSTGTSAKQHQRCTWIGRATSEICDKVYLYFIFVEDTFAQPRQVNKHLSYSSLRLFLYWIITGPTEWYASYQKD